MKAAQLASENLIKPCAIWMAELVLGTEAAKKMKDVPLSDDVIAGRVADMSCDILDQIVWEIKIVVPSALVYNWTNQRLFLTRVS